MTGEDLGAGRCVCCWWSRTTRTMRAYCSSLARDRGFKVLLARTGAEALALARKYRPAAVSLDVFLPDMLGWTVLNQLKRSSRDAPHPGTDPHHRGRTPIRARARRVLVHHARPLTTDELEAAFDRLEELHRRRASAACWWSRTIPPSR